MKRCRPRILLVEDDPVSRAYLAAALETLPATVDAVVDAATALRASTGVRGGHALWLVDAHLPDTSGANLLARLRARTPWTPAIAHTASRERDEIEALLVAGFDRVLCKPIAAAALRAAAAAALRPRTAVAEASVPARWNIAALRPLFLAELPAQQAAVATALAAGDHAAAGEVLHRMRAACALVGARALEMAVQVLQREPGSAAALRGFNQAVAALLRA